jgi:hypothetical protein
MIENMEERPDTENRIAIMARLPKKAEVGFEKWRAWLGMNKGAFAVLCIRLGMVKLAEVLDPYEGNLPPEDALEVIEQVPPDEKDY